MVKSVTGVCLSGLSSVPFPSDVTSAFAAIGAAVKSEGIDAAKAIWKTVGWFTPALANTASRAALEAIVADYSGWHWLNKNPFVPLDPPPAARLAEIAKPVLTLLGDLDLPYNHEISDALARGIPGARAVVVPHAGHMLPMEDPRATTDALLSFFDAI
jgi:pimeloyl-ACP methyl ester carboxylesterase